METILKTCGACLLRFPGECPGDMLWAGVKAEF